MPDGHFPDVELLRRELAALILEWAGKTVNDDPEGPLSTALIRAVSDAARSAVAEQHQILTAEAADRIAEALERRGRTGASLVWRAPFLGLGLMAVAAVALVAIAFFLGLQAGRKDNGVTTAPAAAAVAIAPLAPAAPAADEPDAEQAPTPSSPRLAPLSPPIRSQRANPAPAPAKSDSRPAPRALGRPATTTGQASPRMTQPVGAATPAPAAPASATTP